MKLAEAVDIYVMRRRAMGEKCEGPTVALRVFSRRYNDRSLQGITLPEVKQFLDVPQTGPAAWRRKYGVLRDFFAYWRCRGKLNAVPTPLAAPKYIPTFVPYIYSRRELRLLLDAVPGCQRHAACRISEITLRTLLLFLYGTGMRVGEALRLRLADVDLNSGVITIRGTKFYKSRLVPLGADVVQILRKYLAAPGRWNQHYRPLFQSRQHKRLGHSTVDANFRRLCILAGVRRSDTSSRQPRLHDLRHAFAVHRLTEWYRTGANVQLLLPALFTYLGHVDLHSMQCYLTMTPELLGEANRRFQDYVYGGRHEE
jgi:site-specific recombinase XerD